jgi:hypothetical protein
VPRDCLGALYDLTFGGREISRARAEEYLEEGAGVTS